MITMGNVVVFDTIRSVVLSETIMLMTFFLITALRSANTARCTSESVIRHLAWGRFFSSLGIEFLLFNEVTDIIARFGQHTMNWKTPYLQATMIILTVGYIFRDRVSIAGSIR